MSPLTILQVNHGYPERYNAGSEIYAQNLSRALAAAGQRVSVFAREEDPFRPDFQLREERDGELPVHLVNMPRSQSRWQHDEVDAAFASVVRKMEPDVVHFHHLNHLSIGLPSVAAAAGASVVFTAHDFWLACPRGQRVQWALGGEPWPLCPGQEDDRCARACHARAFTGEAACSAKDVEYWTAWVRARMAAVEAQLDHIEVIVSPSQTVASALTERFPSIRPRLRLMDYGFPVRRPAPRVEHDGIVFGYLGTHVPTKGIDLLIRAFARVRGPAALQIHGRIRGQESEALRRLAAHDERIAFFGEYGNSEVMQRLAALDAVVVPSVWLENSPLVIHEAQQARTCVITADAGGMAEYVAHEKNGLLFHHRDEGSLVAAMQRVVDDPPLASRLGAAGYLHTASGEVLSIEDQAFEFVDLYRQLRGRRSRDT